MMSQVSYQSTDRTTGKTRSFKSFDACMKWVARRAEQYGTSVCSYPRRVEE